MPSSPACGWCARTAPSWPPPASRSAETAAVTAESQRRQPEWIRVSPIAPAVALSASRYTGATPGRSPALLRAGQVQDPGVPHPLDHRSAARVRGGAAEPVPPYRVAVAVEAAEHGEAEGGEVVGLGGAEHEGSSGRAGLVRARAPGGQCEPRYSASHGPVTLPASRATSAGVPVARTRPPSGPPPGPMSMR